MSNTQEAERLYRKVIEIDKFIDEDKPVDQQDELLYIKYFGLGEALEAQGRYDEAIESYETARAHAIRVLGSGEHWDAGASYFIANLLYNRGEYPIAKSHYLKALDIYTRDNRIHPTTSAASLKLSYIAMKEGRNEDAIATLRKTRIVCQLNEQSKGDRGDTARVLRALSKALEAVGSNDEAQELMKEAESIRKNLQGEKFQDLPNTEQSYNLLVNQMFW